MNKEQKTIKKIQELVPEIMQREILYRCNRVWEAWSYNTMGENDFEEVDLSENITLEDVAIAVSKKQGEWHTTFWGNGVIRIDKNIDWIPNKPFHKQSQKCKDFIGDLIS